MSRSSWLPRPIVLVVARTEFWSVSTLALIEIVFSVAPSFALSAGGVAGGASGGGGTWASAATWSKPKPAASAPSGNRRGAGDAERTADEGSDESGSRFSTVLFLSGCTGWRRRAGADDGDGGRITSSGSVFRVRSASIDRGPRRARS